MAEKSRGGGFGWFVVGVLAGIAVTLGALAFINLRVHRERMDGRSGADEAAAAAAAQAAQTPAPIAPPPAAVVKPPHTPPASPGQPTGSASDEQRAQDYQIQDDAAATGNTARARPPQ